MRSLKNMSGEKRRRLDWEKLVQEYSSSKKSISAFCYEHHLSTAAFYYWRAKLDPNYIRSRPADKQSELVQQKPEFIAVQLSGKSESQQNATLYYPNGCYVRINESLSPRLLRLLNEGMGLSC